MVKINSIIEESFGQKYNHEQDLFEQGMTSLSILKLVDVIKKKYDVEIDLDIFLETPTVKNLATLVESKDQIGEDIDKTGKIPEITTSTIDSDKYTNWLKEDSVVAGYSFSKDLFEQGMTSLGIIRLVQEFQEANNVSIELEELLSLPTLSNLVYLACHSKNYGEVLQVDTVSKTTVSASVSELVSEDKQQSSGLLTTEKEKKRFLAKSLNFRSYPHEITRIVGTSIDCDSFQEKYSIRKSRRKFEKTAVDLESLLGWLSNLNCRDDEDEKQYLYPSAGGTYAVQVFVEAKDNGVLELDAGAYYYHPLRRELVHISNDSFSRDKHFYYNRECYDASQFCIYLVADTQAIEPLYGKQTELFVAVEAGCMLQLLSSIQNKYDIGGCILAGVNDNALKDFLRLEKSGKVLLSMACGRTRYGVGTSDQNPTSGDCSLTNNQLVTEKTHRFQLSKNQLGLWSSVIFKLVVA